MDQESRHGLAGVLVLGSLNAVIRVLAEVAVSSEGLTGGLKSKLTDVLIGDSFPHRLLDQALRLSRRPGVFSVLVIWAIHRAP